MGSVQRMREGAERFMITDINNPAGSAQAQSEIFLMMDAWGSTDRGVYIQIFNHVPGGSNVLYMDGHVSYVKYNTGPPIANPLVTGTTGPTSTLAGLFIGYFVGGWG